MLVWADNNKGSRHSRLRGSDCPSPSPSPSPSYVQYRRASCSRPDPAGLLIISLMIAPTDRPTTRARGRARAASWRFGRAPLKNLPTGDPRSPRDNDLGALSTSGRLAGLMSSRELRHPPAPDQTKCVQVVGVADLIWSGGAIARPNLATGGGGGGGRAPIFAGSSKQVQRRLALSDRRIDSRKDRQTDRRAKLDQICSREQRSLQRAQSKLYNRGRRRLATSLLDAARLPLSCAG